VLRRTGDGEDRLFISKRRNRLGARDQKAVNTHCKNIDGLTWKCNPLESTMTWLSCQSCAAAKGIACVNLTR
jgi:hypothetical protein